MEDRGFRGKVGYGKIPAGPNGGMVDVFGLLIVDEGTIILIERIFSRAYEYWNKLFVEVGYLDGEDAVQ